MSVSGNVAILAILAIHGKARPSHERQPGRWDQHRPWAASASGQCPLLTVAGPRPQHEPQSRPGQPQVCDQGCRLLSQSALSCSCLQVSSCHPAHHAGTLILFSVFLMLSYVALAGLLPLTLLEAESLSGCIIETSYLETEFQERKLFFWFFEKLK